jgi:putative Ig domain-containing protein
MVLGLGLLACAAQAAPAAPPSASEQGAGQDAGQPDAALVVENDSDLPDTYPGARFSEHLRTRGGVTPLHWEVTFGTLPPGLQLEDNGELHGQPQRAGEFHFQITVTDSGAPRVTAHQSFTLRVLSAFTVDWKTPAHVDGNRISGTVAVTNTTEDDLDLTFYVLAVAGDGRATAIGYQHFLLRRATPSKILPFGETLPRGGYDIHVDAVGEVAAKKLILRHHLQAPQTLQVTAGP